MDIQHEYVLSAQQTGTVEYTDSISAMSVVDMILKHLMVRLQ